MKNERVGVGGVLFQEGQVLLGKRSPHRTFYPSVWDIIGGHREAGENTIATLHRELDEEIGVVPIEYRLLSVLAEPTPELNGPGQYHVYLVTSWDGTPQNLRPDEHSEVAWIKVSEIDKLEVAHPSYSRLFRSLSN